MHRQHKVLQHKKQRVGCRPCRRCQHRVLPHLRQEVCLQAMHVLLAELLWENVSAGALAQGQGCHAAVLQRIAIKRTVADVLCTTTRCTKYPLPDQQHAAPCMSAGHVLWRGCSTKDSSGAGHQIDSRASQYSILSNSHVTSQV